MYQWNWSEVLNYKRQLLDAALSTILLNLLVIIIGSFGGLLLGILKRSRYRAIRIFVGVMVDIIRTLPVLVLLIWVNYCVPLLIPSLKMSSYSVAVTVLSLNLAAFIAEIVYAGLESVPQIHTDSSRMLGFSQLQTLRYITLPVALRNMLPPLVGQYINAVKLSVLASVIAVPELLNVTQDIITQTYRPLEFYTVLALFFLLLLLPGTLLSKRFENRAFMKKKSKE